MIDTDVAIDVLRGNAAALQWFRSDPDVQWVMSGYAAMEILYGSRDENELRRADTLLHKVRIAWLDADAQQAAYQTLRSVHSRNAVGVIDVLIAHTSLSLNLPLHTFNRKHFDVIPNLVTVQPYVR